MSFAPVTVEARWAAVRAALVEAELDALLVTRLPNIRYLTGFTGSAGVLLVGPEAGCFVTDGRYAQQSREQLDAARCPAAIEITNTEQRERLAAAAAEWGVARLGFEAQGLTWATHRTFAEAFAPIELEPTEALVEKLREVKEPAEVERVRAACAIGDAALTAVLPLLATGPRETDVALALEVAMRERGASANSFDPIVASGPNGAMPHARPGPRRIERHELVVLDFGCVVDGYCSDMTRTVSVGDPGPEARATYELVLASQLAGRDAVAPGVECAAVDAASRDVIAAAGQGEWFSHGTGHGVGLEIHEAPRVAATASDTLAVGHVVTVEPGIYRPGVGGVRIEDTVVVTDVGADPLTLSSKELIL